jgi:enterochelin esterase-like enzyme
VKLRDQLQPPEARRYDQNGGTPANGRPERAPRSSRGFSWPRLLVLVACLAWIAFGIRGAFSYGDAYYVYRGFEPPTDPAGIAPGRLILERFYSPALHQPRSFKVYLPPGYAAESAAGRRFPVLYLLHGSPGGSHHFVNAGAVGVKLDRLVAAKSIRPFLIVMPNGGNGSFFHDTEWADTPSGRFESFVLDVVRAADARLATLPQRQFRAIAGLSEGAYAALNISLHHLGTFSIAGSWSGYFLQHSTGAFAGASLSTLRANSPVLYVPQMSAALHRLPLHAYIYVGKRDKAVPDIRGFATELSAAGGHVRFAVYPGGHDWKLWRGHMDDMLKYANRWFSSGAVGGIKAPVRARPAPLLLGDVAEVQRSR